MEAKVWTVRVEGEVVFSEEYADFEDAQVAAAYWESEDPEAVVTID